MRRFWILLIGFYQRFISPYKGFRCAHAVYHSGPSCSSAVKTIISQYGLIKGLPAIRKRFAECRQAYCLILAEQSENKSKKGKKKSGKCKQQLKEHCGLDCLPDPCDALSFCSRGDSQDSGCDVNPCDSSPCDVGPCDCSP